MSDRFPPSDASAAEQNEVAGIISDYLAEHEGYGDYVPFSLRFGLARTILNAGYRKEAQS